MPALRKLIVACILAAAASAALGQTAAPPRVDTANDTLWYTATQETAETAALFQEARETKDALASAETADATRRWPEPAIWIALITLFILLLSLLVSFIVAEYMTRPTLSVSVEPVAEGEKGLHVFPAFRNSSTTDAQGVVKLLLEVNGERFEYETEQGAYSGQELWSFPAKQEVTGNAPLTSRIQAHFAGGWNRNWSVAIELETYYSRFPSLIRPRILAQLHKWSWLRSAVYAAPVQRHELKQTRDGKRWVLVPHLDNRRKPTESVITKLRH